MMKWDSMTDQEQVYLWWEFVATCDDEEANEMTFEEFAQLMRDMY